MKTAIITGGSSGIGLELGRELTRRGYRVALLARRADLLEEAARAIPGAVAIACDVTDAASVRSAVDTARSALGPLDLAVANAGVSIPMSAVGFSSADAERVIRTNYLGMIYLFEAVIPEMIERRSGHFAGIASLAGLKGLPRAATYSASKAAMQTFLEGARAELQSLGVQVTTINPGFIRTPMTEKNRFRMPLLMDVDEAVRIIADALERRARVVDFPRPMSLLMRTMRLLPAFATDYMFRGYAKRALDMTKVRR